MVERLENSVQRISISEMARLRNINSRFTMVNRSKPDAKTLKQQNLSDY